MNETPVKAEGLAAVSRRIAAHWLKLAAALTLIAVVFAIRIAEPGPAEVFLWRQDLPVLAAITAALIALPFIPVRGIVLPAFKRPFVLVAGLAALCTMIAGLAAPLIFEGYTLSLDEFMANFDARIFASGRLMAPVAQEWRGYLAALQPIYTLQTPGHDFWASSYLPLNAAFRAAAGMIGVEGWANPVWAGISILAIYGVGRRLWPGRPGPALAAAVLMATSAQFLIMAMTAYAMSAHLALNLVWLWLFLRGGKAGTAGAVAVAFVACGLHQVIFHPMFAAPFILELMLSRRWGRAGLFAAAYGVIGLFWIAYWGWLYQWVGVAPQAAQAVGGGWFVERVLELFAKFSPGGIGSIAEGLVRFITWQNLLTIPLATIGVAATIRRPGPARAMALGVLITVLAMWVLVPDQTHGWGYRYLHGFIGSVCLLAVYGAIALTEALAKADRHRTVGVFAIAALASLVILAPVRAWQAHAFNHPYAVAGAGVRQSKAQVVIVDNGSTGFDMGAVVRNDPFLHQEPRVMLLNSLNEMEIRDLCGHHKVAVFDAHDPAAKGILTFKAPWEAEARRLRAVMAESGCG